MYLADRDIKSLGSAMQIEGPNAEHPFEPDAQIQPCSIDLRISNVFWVPRRRRWLGRRLMPWRSSTIDLRESNVHALNAFRDWKKVEIAEGHTVTIKPGQTVMGRIYERFRMPVTCAGKIEGRSSFARLGLSVHCTGDFINPGWEGYMPLQLTNAGDFPIKLAPYFPICQLMLVSLTSEPERSYGGTELDSKYINDDGGPSLWWRDARVKELQGRLNGFDIAESIQEDIVDAIRFKSTAVLSRFTRYIGKQSREDLEHSDQVLDGFAAKETTLRLVDIVLMALVPIFAGGAISAVPSLGGPLEGNALTLTILLIASLIPALVAYERREDGYFGRAELSNLRSSRDRPKGGAS